MIFSRNQKRHTSWQGYGVAWTGGPGKFYLSLGLPCLGAVTTRGYQGFPKCPNLETTWAPQPANQPQTWQFGLEMTGFLLSDPIHHLLLFL